jgi:DNA-binding response OmpR family regulator
MQPNVARKRVLIAEDDTPLLTLISSILAREGHEIYLAANGADAVEAHELFTPYLVIWEPVRGSHRVWLRDK